MDRDSYSFTPVMSLTLWVAIMAYIFGERGGALAALIATPIIFVIYKKRRTKRTAKREREVMQPPKESL